MSSETVEKTVSLSPQFDSFVQSVLDATEKSDLEKMREDFHTRLRITMTQPDNTDLVEDLWDYFYDWCFFEQNLPEHINDKKPAEDIWNRIKTTNQRGLYLIQKTSDTGLKLKDLLSGETLQIPKKDPNNRVAFTKGDILEARLAPEDPEEKKKRYFFVRKPCYHPLEIHPYLKAKLKDFKKTKDSSSYQNWLWLLVGMYLKHRLYSHLPIEKIYDDNSRI